MSNEKNIPGKQEWPQKPADNKPQRPDQGSTKNDPKGAPKMDPKKDKDTHR